MDIIKTILKLSFFLLGCVMLMFTLLVIPVGAGSVLFFASFSIVFFLLGYSYTFRVIKKIVSFILKLLHIKRKTAKKSKKVKDVKEVKKDKKIKKTKEDKKVEVADKWISFKNENITYSKALKQIKLNSKVYDLSGIVSVELIANSKKVNVKELKKIDKIKKLEIKVGTKIKKVTYRNFKYVTSTKISDKKLKKSINNAISDYKKFKRISKKKI